MKKSQMIEVEEAPLTVSIELPESHSEVTEVALNQVILEIDHFYSQFYQLPSEAKKKLKNE